MGCAVLSTLFVFIFLPRLVYLTYYPTVFWTSNNCRFKLNGLKGKGYFYKVKAMSNLVFMCPNSAFWIDKSDTSPNRRMMRENILRVDEESYKSCSIKNKTQAKQLLVCDSDPMNRVIEFSEETFSSTQANPGKLCYEMGKHYYFISTSTGLSESLNNTEGGHCKTHNMKLHIYVCNETEPCEFEMPECPKGNKGEREDGENVNVTVKPTRNCSDNSVSVAAQSGAKEWFQDNRHPIFYSIMGLIILTLVVIILCILYSNRKLKRLSGVNIKSGKRKSSIEKEPFHC